MDKDLVTVSIIVTIINISLFVGNLIIGSNVDTHITNFNKRCIYIENKIDSIINTNINTDTVSIVNICTDKLVIMPENAK